MRVMLPSPLRRSLRGSMTAAIAMTAIAGTATVRTAGPDARGLTAVEGLRVGSITLTERPTGCTVIVVEGEGAVGGVSQRGGAPGTRETDLLDPGNMVDKVNAVVLSGGSAFGLDAATGAVRWLEEQNLGWDVRIAKVPIVPAAILFDLPVGGNPKVRPTADCGYKAAAAATSGPVQEGSIGAGAGATVGKMGGPGRSMKAGLGSYAVAMPNGLVVAAIVAVNAVGDIIDPDTAKVVAGVRTAENTLADARHAAARRPAGGAATAGREHDHRPGRHQRPALQGRRASHGADGRRRVRARHLPLAHDGRRRHRLLAGHRPVDRRREHHADWRARRRRDGQGDRPGRHRGHRPAQPAGGARPGAK